MQERRMDVRMIVTDLDGTLFAPHSVLTERTRKAIQNCEARGIPVVLASGRNFLNLRAIAGKAGLRQSPIIATNGARIEAGLFGQTLMEQTSPVDVSRAALEILLKSGMNIQCHTRDTVYEINGHLSPWLKTPDEYSPMPEAVTDEDGFTEHYSESVEAMYLNGMPRTLKYAAESRNLDALEKLRKELLQLPLSVTSSSRVNLEIMGQGMGKGAAVRFLAEYYHLQTSQIMAFGDQTNDLEMLECAGIPVAMENGADALKENAAIVAPPNTEDGVAQVLEAYVCGPSGS